MKLRVKNWLVPAHSQFSILSSLTPSFQTVLLKSFSAGRKVRLWESDFSKGAIQIVAHIIRENYFAFNRANRKQGDLCSLPANPVIANPQGEAIHASTLDCFTLRIRNDVRDNLNYLSFQIDRHYSRIFFIRNMHKITTCNSVPVLPGGTGFF
jgi:hypothetical protein